MARREFITQVEANLARASLSRPRHERGTQRKRVHLAHKSARSHQDKRLFLVAGSVFHFGEATLSQAVRSGPIVVVFMDSSASTPMKYLDDFVDSLGVTDHTMIAADDAFRSGALEVTAPIRDHPI